MSQLIIVFGRLLTSILLVIGVGALAVIAMAMAALLTRATTLAVQDCKVQGCELKAIVAQATTAAWAWICDTGRRVVGYVGRKAKSTTAAAAVYMSAGAVHLRTIVTEACDIVVTRMVVAGLLGLLKFAARSFVRRPFAMV